jgi:hypothetical protein
MLQICPKKSKKAGKRESIDEWAIFLIKSQLHAPDYMPTASSYNTCTYPLKVRLNVSFSFKQLTIPQPKRKKKIAHDFQI